EYSMDKERIDAVIEAAVQKAERLGVKGKNITPFLLAEIKDVTGGDSLETNIALVFNNVRLASAIACALE
ncbi:MAG: pseudouridine-5'-phosphate glycosidase, partial [Clostridia bacterium]|nr:pseudouridine-5'-phosphate glycosidase [Clostridia bacterium]